MDKPRKLKQEDATLLRAWQHSTLVQHMRLLPNQITAIRFLAIPLMWMFVFQTQLSLLAIGLVISLISDLLDGASARRLNQVTDFGAKFDSLSDRLLQLSALLWIALLMPEIYAENRLVLLSGVSLYIIATLVGWVKFKQVVDLQLYLSKLGGLFIYIFLIHSFSMGVYSPVLFLCATLFLFLSSVEILALNVTSSSVPVEAGSIFLRGLEDDHPVRSWLARLP